MDSSHGTFEDLTKRFPSIVQRNEELQIKCLKGAKSELSRLLEHYYSEKTRKDIDSLSKLVTEIETKRKAIPSLPMVPKERLRGLEIHIKILHEKSRIELYKHYKETQDRQIRQVQYIKYPTDLRTTHVNQHHTDHPHEQQQRYKHQQQQQNQQRQLQSKQQIQKYSESHHQQPQQQPESHPHESPKPNFSQRKPQQQLESYHEEPQQQTELHHKEQQENPELHNKDPQQQTELHNKGPQQQTHLNPQEPQLRPEFHHREQQQQELHHKESRQQSKLYHPEPQLRPELHNRELQRRHKYVQTEEQQQKQEQQNDCFDRKPDMHYERDEKISDKLEHQDQERNKDCKILKLTKEIEHLRTRLSQFSSLKMREGNPNIADLGDSNRPTKLAEYFSELYDNEWTDAFEEMSAYKMNEMEVIEILLTIVEGSFEYCSTTSNKQLSALHRSFQKQIVSPNTSKDDVGNRMSYANEQQREFLPSIKELRKTFARFTLPHLKQTFETLANNDIYEGLRNGTSLKVYVDRCVELCWFMCIQDPPMCLEFCKKGDGNTGDFRGYTQTGKKVEFCVWPCVRLYKGGPLMMKGVAQMR